MTSIIYSLGLIFYYFVIWMVSPFNHKAHLWIQGRRNLFKQLPSRVNPADQWIWFHCSSLGEFEQGRPLIELLKKKTQYKILLTFFSPSGYEVRKNYPFADYVCYLPPDSRRNATRFLDLVNPSMAVFIKYDFWYFYFTGLKSRNIPLFIVSGILRDGMIYFRKNAGIFNRIPRCVTHFFVQDEKSVGILKNHGITTATKIDDTRIDRVAEIAASASQKSFPAIEKFIDGKKILVAGSSYSTEEKFISMLQSKGVQGWKYIVVPHHTEENHIRQVMNLYGEKAVRYSMLENTTDPKDYSILIIDTVGILSTLYKYASMVLIGGGFDKGVHNTLEPACFGVPVIIGPKNHQKFREITGLISLGGIVLIHNFNEFSLAFDRFQDPEHMKTAGLICRRYIQQHTGGTDLVMKELEKYLR